MKAVAGLLMVAALMAGCAPAAADIAVREAEPERMAAFDLAPKVPSVHLASVVENGVAIEEPAVFALATAQPGFTSNPREVLQLPEMPSGCEISALTAALQSMGFDVDDTEIAREHLTITGDYYSGYVNSPFTSSGAGFPPGIVAAANSYLENERSTYRAYDLTGTPFTAVEALVDAGYPVVAWTTLDHSAPNFMGSIWYTNEHCVTMYASDGATVLVNDPLAGLVKLDRANFAATYEQCGMRALFMR